MVIGWERDSQYAPFHCRFPDPPVTGGGLLWPPQIPFLVAFLYIFGLPRLFIRNRSCFLTTARCCCQGDFILGRTY